MSLRVWLPLNGDLHNQGVSAVTATNNGATVDTTGKIGSCYSFDGTDDFITLNNFNPNGWPEISITAWVYPTTTFNSFFLIRGGGAHRLHINANGFIFRDTNNSTLRTIAFGQTIPLNTWTHIACIYKQGEIWIYLNGILSAHNTTYYNVSSILLNDLSEYRIARAQSSSGNSYYTGKINDFRIYNHCLSVAEVKEIAQGLVLHYKLDSGLFGNPNVLTNSTGNLGSTAGWSGVVSLGTDGSSPYLIASRTDTTSSSRTFVNHGNIKSLIPWATAGTHFTLSGYYKVPSNVAYNVQANMFLRWTHTAGANAYSDTGWYTPNSTAIIKDKWIYFEQHYTVPTNYVDGGINFYLSAFSTGLSTVYWKDIKLEEGNTATPWCPAYSEMNIDRTIIEDSSGYNHNGEILNGPLSFTNDTSRYDICTHFSATNQKIKISNFPTSGFGNSYTFAWWAKISSTTPMHWGFSDGIRLNGMYTGRLWNTGDSSNNPLYIPGTTTQVTAPTVNVWHHWAMTGDGTKCRVYQDGVLWAEAKTYKAISGTTIYINGWDNGTSYSSDNYSISDFRIYCTPLLDTDIKQLYNVSMKIDKLGSAHSFEFIEQQSNIIFPIELSRSNLEFTNGLSRYTQANCQVTLTDQGYRIYRPPNLTTANDGNTMWGGLLINNQTSRVIQPYNATQDNIFNLQKNHTYMFAFHAKGQSSNSPSLIVESNMGRDRIAGVGPNPTYIKSRTIPADFNGEQDCYIIFKIEDDIVKVATENKSSYIQGNSYLSYRDLCLNYGYTSTGTLGTDLYLTNFRLYDITTAMAKITKQGQAKFDDFVEQLSKTQIRRNSELLSSQFIER